MASQADRYTQIVNVYQAVGGGWVDEADKLAPQPHLALPVGEGSPTAAR